MELKNEIGKRLKHARKKRGLSQQTAAELSKISVRQFGNIERGVCIPVPDTLIRIYKMFDISIYDLQTELPDKE